MLLPSLDPQALRKQTRVLWVRDLTALFANLAIIFLKLLSREKVPLGLLLAEGCAMGTERRTSHDGRGCTGAWPLGSLGGLAARPEAGWFFSSAGVVIEDGVLGRALGAVHRAHSERAALGLAPTLAWQRAGHQVGLLANARSGRGQWAGESRWQLAHATGCLRPLLSSVPWATERIRELGTGGILRSRPTLQSRRLSSLRRRHGADRRWEPQLSLERALHRLGVLPAMVHPARILHNASLRPVLLVGQHHILQGCPQVAHRDHRCVGVTQQLLPEVLVLEDREATLELADVPLRLLQVVEHVLVASLVQYVVLLGVEHLGPALALAPLPLLHLGAPELEAPGHVVLELPLSDFLHQVGLHQLLGS